MMNSTKVLILLAVEGTLLVANLALATNATVLASEAHSMATASLRQTRKETAMENEKVYCPYCGPWNGHPKGVLMVEDGNGCAGPERFGYPEQFWFYCPACAAESPCANSREEAIAAANQRFTPDE